MGDIAIQFGYQAPIINKRVNFPKPFKTLLAVVPILSGSDATSREQPVVLADNATNTKGFTILVFATDQVRCSYIAIGTI